MGSGFTPIACSAELNSPYWSGVRVTRFGGIVMISSWSRPADPVPPEHPSTELRFWSEWAPLSQHQLLPVFTG